MGVTLVKKRVGDKTGNIPRMNKLDCEQIGVTILLFHNKYFSLFDILKGCAVGTKQRLFLNKKVDKKPTKETFQNL